MSLTMTPSTPPPSRRAHRPPRFNIKNMQNLNTGSAMGSMPPTAQPPYTAQTNHTAMGQPPYWPQYANPFAAGNFMAKGFEGFVDFTKSGMSFGEKFTYGLYNKISKWSKRWFTHIFLLFVVGLYSAGGAVLFGAIEGSAATHKHAEIHGRQRAFFKAVRHLSEDPQLLSRSDEYDGQLINTMRNFQDAVESMLNNNKTLEELEQLENPWNFWNAMVYCGTIYTTIAQQVGNVLHLPTARGPSMVSETVGVQEKAANSNKKGE